MKYNGIPCTDRGIVPREKGHVIDYTNPHGILVYTTGLIQGRSIVGRCWSGGCIQGSGVLAPTILVEGVQEKFPVPWTCNWRVSILQMSVSRKGKKMGGFRVISTIRVTLSRQPLVLETIKVTCFIPVSLYFQDGLGRVELSAVWLASPKFQYQDETRPYFDLVVSVNKTGFSTQVPRLVNPGKKPGKTLICVVALSVQFSPLFT